MLRVVADRWLFYSHPLPAKYEAMPPAHAKIQAGGNPISRPGYFFAPTIISDLRQDDELIQEEIFGPVVSVLPFQDEAEAIALANASDYGLSGSIWTNDLGRAMRVSRAIESGNLSVNSHSSVRFWTPFGGFKQSGLGRALGPDALDAYTETKNVFFATE